ncbi:MAG: type IV pilin-like G/H family protein, partial [Cyanobacteriota bacterium]
PSPVIVKLLAFNPQMHWDELKLFEREAQVLKNLNHSRIPQYLDYFSVDDLEGSGFLWFGLVQEYIPGDSLKQLLDKGKHFTEVEVRSIATEVLRILINLHELSPPVLHRDIKPSNLILGKNNQIYLVDFGAVQDRAKAEGVTFTVVGTSGYAPPEQLWGKAVPASDLYALGATLIHLLTGISPAELPQHRMRIQFKERININPDFANWIEQLIQPAPERRFSTARQALEGLQAQASHSSSAMREKVSEVEVASNSPNYVVGSLVVLIGFGFIFYLGSLSSLLDSSTKSKQAEAKNNIFAMNRAQEGYLLEYEKFTDSFSDLGIGMKSQTENYSYSIRVTDKAVFNYGVSRQKKLKSYVGGVFVVPATNFDPNADRKEMTTVAIACEAVHPGTTKPVEPTLQNGQPACGASTRNFYRQLTTENSP